MPDIFVAEPKKAAKKSHPAAVRKPLVSVHSLPGHSHNPFAAYCYHPDRVRFETQEENEQVILLLRKHPITNIPWIIISILMVFAPTLLSVFPLIGFLPENYQLIALLGWYLITTAYIIQSFLAWFFNVNIITDERIIDVDFVNLIYKEVTEAKIDKIQDVTFRMGSVIRTLFNYGDVLVQTASEVPRFEFEAVPKPDEVSKVLNELLLEEEQEKIEGRVS